MRIARRAIQAIALISWASLIAGCGVGPYHIPDVAPVVKPEPEENLLAEFGLEEMDAETDTEESSDEGDDASEEAAEPADEGAAEAESSAAEPAEEPKGSEKKAAPQKKPAAGAASEKK